MRAALYTRVSSQEQAQHGVSLAEQKERLEAWAKIEGWEIAGIYTDEGYTGGDDNRPDLQRLMADAKAGAFNLIAVSKLDRFFRNTRLLLNYVEEMKPYGVGFASQSEGINTNKPGMGDFLLGIFGSIAGFEKQRIGERISNFRQHLANRGQWSSGRTPFGYRFNKETKELDTDPLEADAVRFIFNTYTGQQLGIVRTAELCNQKELITPRGGRRKHTTWNQSAIRHILTHPAYKGGPGEGWQFKTPAIVSPELWEQAQRQLANNRHFRATENHNPFTGLLRCGLCGKTLRTGYNHTTTPVWECPGRLKVTHLDGSPRCTLPRRKADELTTWLVKTTSGIFSDPDNLKEYIADTIKNLQAERDTLERKLKPIQSSTKRIQEQMAKADTMFEVGRLSREDYRARISGLRKQLAELEKQTTEADPLLLAQLRNSDKALAYYQTILQDSPNSGSIADMVSKFKETHPYMTFFSDAELTEALEVGHVASIIAPPGEVPVIDWADAALDDLPAYLSNYLRQFSLFAYVYPAKVEIKGAIRQTNILSGYRSARCRQSRQRGAVAVSASP